MNETTVFANLTAKKENADVEEAAFDSWMDKDDFITASFSFFFHQNFSTCMWDCMV